MREFATAEKPLRASRLPALVLCTWRAVAEDIGVIDRGESGKAADTGTAIHLAVAAWHTNGKSLTDAVAAMRAASAAFPLAELDKAERVTGRYCADPRNRDAEVVEVEKKITLTLQPKFVAGPPIVITGTLDQLRREDDGLSVWDLKTGNRDGLYMQNNHALQLAAYSLAVGARPGGYIRTKGYFTRGASLPSPDGVFVPADIDDPDTLLDAVRWAVCCVREGYVIATPGTHCETCTFAGFARCLPQLQMIN